MHDGDRLQNFENLVTAWATERGLFDPPNPMVQAKKTQEELDELFQGIRYKNKEEIVDAIGDIVVTLVIQARMHGYTLGECIWVAWDQIKDRKGRTENGLFIKEVT